MKEAILLQLQEPVQDVEFESTVQSQLRPSVCINIPQVDIIFKEFVRISKYISSGILQLKLAKWKGWVGQSR